MEIKTITSGLSVSPQITAADMKAIKEAGFRSVICNRPDGEGADQPTFEELAKAAKKLGLEATYLPIMSGKVDDADANAFGAALGDLPGPTLAFCRTGTRSATLWSLSQAKTLGLSDILAATKAAGYDMGGVVRRIAKRDPCASSTAATLAITPGAGVKPIIFGGANMVTRRRRNRWRSSQISRPARLKGATGATTGKGSARHTYGGCACTGTRWRPVGRTFLTRRSVANWRVEARW